MKSVKHIFIFSMLVLPMLLNAQVYNFRNYTIRDGFPQSNSSHLSFDKKGYLWTITQKGLVRFDGIHFKLFNIKDSLPSKLIKEYYQCDNGTFYLITEKGLSKWKPEKLYYTLNIPEYNLSSIYCFHYHNNQVYAGGKKGLFIIEKDSLRHIETSNGIIIRNILTYKGELLIQSNKALYAYQDNSLIKTEINLPDTVSIKDIAIDKSNNIWLASNLGLIKISNKDYEIYNISDGLIDNELESICIDSMGIVWYGSEGRGIGSYDGEKIISYKQENGFSNTSVLDLAIDHEGNLWVGGRTGLTTLKHNDPFIHYNKINNNDNTIILGMMQTEDSTIWMATYGSGIVGLKNGQFTNLYSDFPDNRFFDIVKVEDKIYLASASHGVLIYNTKKQEIETEIAPHKNLRVFCLLKDDSCVWAGTSGAGLLKITMNDYQQYSTKDGLTSDRVMSLCKDTSNTLWIGTVGGGVCKLDDGEISSYTKEDGLEPNYIRSIASDNNGRIWFGSATHGIFSIVKNDDSVNYEFINPEKGLSSENVYLMIFDNQDRLWVGTEKGVDRIDFQKDKYNIKQFSKDEGFVNMETNINGALLDFSSNIWFSTTNGISIYRNGYPERNTYSPRTFLNGILLFHEQPDWQKLGFLLKDNLPVNLELKHNNNHLTFEFIGISLTAPEKVKYSYKLEGLDVNWSPLTSEQKAVYSSIPPGQYTFLLKSYNADGVATKNIVHYSFTILEPWWSSWWFISIAFILFGLLVYLFIQLRVRSLKRAKTVLEQKVQARTAEINQQKEEILAQRDNIESKNEMLEQQNIEIQFKNEQITSSIQYAKRIQKAVFPNQIIFSSLFNDYFILFEPKDIVSGDFFWIIEKEHKTYLAVADCTGHGVPGAFMSMLGISILNEIANTHNKFRDYTAGEILNLLRNLLIASLHQSGNKALSMSEAIKDGMDISFCIVDKDQRQINYSGAHNPLYIFNRKNKKIIRYAADKIPIGIYSRENHQNFTDQFISVSKEDVVYMLTDGYPDQFGGPKGKKYKIKRLKDFFTKIGHLSLNDQKEELEKELYIWMNSDDEINKQEQIDDILIIGFTI